MKGILPKPTLLELDEYDINQRVIEALTTTILIPFAMKKIIQQLILRISLVTHCGSAGKT